MATFTTWRKPYFYVFHFVAFLIVFAWGVSIKICSLSIFLAVCYGHFRQWCVLLPVSLYVKVFQCMLILSFLAICCSISSDSPRKRKGCSRVIKCRKLVTVSFYFCTILSSSSIVILIFFNPTKIIQNKSMYHNISNIYVSSFKSVLGERFSLKERERSLKFAYLVAYATHQFCFFFWKASQIG